MGGNWSHFPNGMTGIFITDEPLLFDDVMTSTKSDFEKPSVLGADWIGGSPKAFNTLTRSGIAKFIKVAKDAEIKMD